MDSPNHPDIYKPTVVIIKGSRSDKPHADDLGNGLQASMLNVIHDTASAHREPEYLVGRLLEYNENKDVIGYVAMAGDSDGLTGTIAAHTKLPVVAYHPDVKKYGEMKKFSSTALPSGSKAFFAYTPEEVLILLKEKSSAPVYTPDELRDRQMKRVWMYFSSNYDRGVETPLGLPLFHKGKTRDVYELGKDQLIINASDRISAFDVNSVTKIPGKGEALTLFSNWWFDQTKHIIPNHVIDMPDPSILRVQKADRIDIEWVMRGYLYGSMARDYAKGERDLYGYHLPDGLRLAEQLPKVMLTPTTKADVGHDLPINKTMAIDSGLVTPGEWNDLEEACFKLYDYYSSTAKQKGFIIPDFKLEFGRVGKNLIQIDEAPNHDSARMWVEKYYKVGENQEPWCVDKEFFRKFLINHGVNPTDPGLMLPEIPDIMVGEIQKRVTAYKVFTGEMSIDNLNLRSLEDVEAELRIKKY